MQYILIKGFYYVVKQSPDADSVKFKATNPALWQQIDTENRQIFDQKLTEEQGAVVLRLQGIDALETHYSASPVPTPQDVVGLTSTILTRPGNPSYGQLSSLALWSAEKLLEMIGVTQVRWRSLFGGSKYINEAHVSDGENSILVKTKWEERIPGYIVTGDVELNGRPLAWAFPGTTTLADGLTMSNLDLASILDQSLNYRLLRQGLVYPYYFMTLSSVLRQRLIAAVQQAQADAPSLDQAMQPNIWRLDRSTAGLAIARMSEIASNTALYPYLFRRLVKHYYGQQMNAYWTALRANATVQPASDVMTLDGFFASGNPYVFVISTQDFVRLEDVVEIAGGTLKMNKSPNDLVFLS
ncbi:MAG: hypothetical protein IT320_09920 [Anaerolineae bacterium]|nr:hypothetical protein [Anaerolineae bacterium]